MPVIRRPDGKIVEKKSRPVDEGLSKIDVKIDSGSADPQVDDRLFAETRKMEEDPPRGRASGEPRTQLFGRRRRPEEEKDLQHAREQSDAMHDPVVGWLVIVDGPGKGRSLQLGLGANSIGRDPDQRVSLDFGDGEISRQRHAIVTYEPRNRKFFVQNGDGSNLTYMNDQPVLIPTELPDKAHINIGSTVLRFVALCGESFDWRDTESAQ